jgi:superfamily II DNA/RNA helicase
MITDIDANRQALLFSATVNDAIRQVRIVIDILFFLSF